MPQQGTENRGPKTICLKKLIESSSDSSPANNDHLNFISIYTHNISGAKTKIPRINDILTMTLFDIICLQETWFDETVEDHEILKNTNFNLVRQDRRDTSHPKLRGGGVAVFIKNDLPFKSFSFPEIQILQYNCILIKKDSSSLLIVNIYFPFGLNAESIDGLVFLLSKMENIPRSDTIIVGDFNMPNLGWSENHDRPGSYLPVSAPQAALDDTSLRFADIFFNADLAQIVPPPSGRNHLDLAFVNELTAFHCSPPLEEEQIDRTSVRHSPMVVFYQVENMIIDRVKTLNLGRTDLTKSKSDLEQASFSAISEELAWFENMSGNTQATYLIERNLLLIRDIVIRNTPIKRTDNTWLSKHPWLRGSREYEIAHRNKAIAKRSYDHDPTAENRDIYRRASFFTSSIFERERSSFISKVVDESSGTTREFYQLMKGSSNTRRDTPETMMFKGVYVSREAKLLAFADQLSSCFLHSPPHLGQDFDSINDSLFDIYQVNFDLSKSSLWNELVLEITPEKVAQYILELKKSKDPGPMGITAEFLQYNVDIVAPIIANAINTIFVTGRIPEEWKLGYLIPIPKKGSQINIENYRGIAIQSCIPKLLDKYLTELLYKHVGHNLSNDQHGFRKGKSTVTNLLETTQLLHENIKNSQVDIIYFDYSKAFDQIRHDLLAKKLSLLGMPYSLYKVIMNFVVGRKYLLKIDGVATSVTIAPLSSVPQGSNFGPILYLIFSNGVGVGEICFADDMKLVQIIKNMEDRNILQARINKLETWARENGLTLNPAKTYHVSYGKKMVASLYFLGNHVIEERETVRDLGVLFDNKLTFSEHIKNITMRTNQMIGAARRLVTSLKKPMLIRRIYAIFIQPIAEYCSIVWNQDRRTLNAPLSLAHKKVTRIALGVYYSMDPSRYIEYDKRCEILNQDGPVIRRATQASIYFVKIIKNLTITSLFQILSNHISTNLEARIPHLRNRHLLHRTDNTIPPKSPVAQILAATAKYEKAIDLSLSVNTIVSKIKEFNASNRTNIANSRRNLRARL